ncbi:MAG: glucose-1-phosphate adenylyltransferase [Myxococcota bacterium]
MQMLAMILAGGEGKRLRPLTEERAKPAVPFGGRYRIIDFVLSNFINSGYYHIKVLSQYKSDSLLKHVLRTWGRYAGFGGYVEPVPPQMNLSKDWYAGSVDAITQNLNIIEDENPELVAVFGGDHVYKMDVRQMADFHREKNAGATVAAIPVPSEEAYRFGCIAMDAQGRMTGFVEKPSNPPEMPGRPGWSLASMGNYIFNRDVLIREAQADAERSGSGHDFGSDLLPRLFERESVYVYDFKTNEIPGEDESRRGYWVDIGTLEAYHSASMDLVSVSPTFNLYNRAWPIRAAEVDSPPAKFVFADQESKRIGIATDSMVCDGCIISGGHLEQSILGQGVRINSYAHVSQSILFDGVNVGRHCRIRRAIIDKGADIPEGTTIGYDAEADAERFFVSDEGIVVIPKGGPLSLRRTSK